MNNNNNVLFFGKPYLKTKEIILFIGLAFFLIISLFIYSNKNIENINFQPYLGSLEQAIIHDNKNSNYENDNFYLFFFILNFTVALALIWFYLIHKNQEINNYFTNRNDIDNEIYCSLKEIKDNSDKYYTLLDSEYYENI